METKSGFARNVPKSGLSDSALCIMSSLRFMETAKKTSSKSFSATRRARWIGGASRARRKRWTLSAEPEARYMRQAGRRRRRARVMQRRQLQPLKKRHSAGTSGIQECRHKRFSGLNGSRKMKLTHRLTSLVILQNGFIPQEVIHRISPFTARMTQRRCPLYSMRARARRLRGRMRGLKTIQQERR